MKYVETKSNDPYYNLAFEEHVLTNCTDDDYIMLWQNDNTIVFGVNQNPLEEINMEMAKKLDVNIVRRSTGGGAVYHDLGNLNFSYITDWDDGENSSYRRFLVPICNVFKEVGLNIEIKGRNDMVLNDRKISGSAQRLLGNRILHHGTLLINSDLDKISKVLNVSVDKIESKGIKSVRSRVTNINDHVNYKLDINEIKELLIRNWFGNIVCSETFDKRTLKKINDLANDKYRTWDWIYARTPEFRYRNKKKFPEGFVEVNLDVEEGKIKECMINGDFLSLKNISDIEDKLKETKYSYKEIKSVLNTESLELYFGKITLEDIMSCFFDD